MERRPQRGRGLTGDSLADLLAAAGVEVPLQHAAGRLVPGAPSPIQRAALPAALTPGPLLAVAPTGSGKTVVLALATLTRLTGPPAEAGAPAALVLAPTRELATQVADVLADLASGSGHTVAAFTGGGAVSRDARRLAGRVDVAVATPGRVLDLLGAGRLSLRRAGLLVLDEADRLVEPTFLPQLDRILAACPPAPDLVAATATHSPALTAALAARFGPTAPHVIEAPSTPDDDGPALTGPPVTVLTSCVSDPAHVAAELADRMTSALMFVPRRSDVRPLTESLAAHGIPADGITGQASPTRRTTAFAALAAGEIRVLVTTDLAGRGLDLPGIGHIVHVGLPPSARDLVHRSGRTGRGTGVTGVVILLFPPTDAERAVTLLDDAGLGSTSLPGGGARLDEEVGPAVPATPPTTTTPETRHGEGARAKRGERGPRRAGGDRPGRGRADGGHRRGADARRRGGDTSRPHRPKRKRRS